MWLFRFAIIGLIASFIPIFLNVNAIQKYPSKIFSPPLYNKIGGSWFNIMGTQPFSKQCHQLNLTETIIEENYFINNNIFFKYHNIEYIDNKTFSMGENLFNIIYYCPIQGFLIINNKFNNDIIVLSQNIHLEEWEYLYIKVSCKFQNFNCDNLYEYPLNCNHS